ncbi:integrase [Frigoribacterium sp. PvP054]|uniref:tyrosine-type recombinase/integrase n=1 Tax=Frigoribacterium sp. PvP054 TaxID=3156438 RepID=UPI00339089DD
MTVTKTPQGRFRAIVKEGRRSVASKTFDRKGDAQTWHDQQKVALALGTAPSAVANRATLGDVLNEWMTARAKTVAGSTLREEGYSIKRIPASLLGRRLGSLRAADFDALYADLLATLSRGTVSRFRNTLSSFYGWAVKQGKAATNPVVDSRVPKGTGTEKRDEVYPFTLAELRAVHEALVAAHGAAKADVALVLGLTGLRWGELAALRVRDVQLVPFPAFRVSRSRPDGQAVRSVTKGGKPRTVPLTGDVLAIVTPLLGRSPDAPLFPSSTGTMLSGNNWKRSVSWAKHSRGRRVHDLRHTAATLWLANGVDLKTVQTWLGHSTAKLTADTYSHWMGSDADAAALARMNAVLGGSPGVQHLEAESGQMVHK